MNRTNRVFLGFVMVIAGAALTDLNVHASGFALIVLGAMLLASYIQP